MSKTYDFLSACGVFYVATINGDVPAVRPFGAVMEYKGHLYVSTSRSKEVYWQLRNSTAIQIVALKPESREWIRILGNAEECTDLVTKDAMLKACPVLAKHFPAPDCEAYVLFKVSDMQSYLCTDTGKERLD